MNNKHAICALVITYNEQDNIDRTLSSIAWVDRILVVDSGSTDATLEIISRYPQASVLHREFTTFAEQCNFGLEHIDEPWVLSIDADYSFPDVAQVSVSAAVARDAVVGYRTAFCYAIYGKIVRGSILPPRTVLYRRQSARYEDDGHGHRVRINGLLEDLPFRLVHDDRKPLPRWLASQVTYAAQEADKLAGTAGPELSLQDKLRKFIVVAPPLVFLLVYVFRGGFLSGWQGLYYALQRLFAELLLSLFLVDRKLRV